jgi:hypothetical protein
MRRLRGKVEGSINKRFGVVALAAVAGWSIAVAATVGANSRDGGSVNLDGDVAGEISQGPSLGAGRQLLTFDISGTLDGGPSIKTVDVIVGGARQSYSYAIGVDAHANTQATIETLDFTATDPTASTFTSRDTNASDGPVIAAADVPAVPETSTWVLMLVGFATIGFALRRGWALKRELAALQSL